jgi:hypothetical protein
VPWTDVDAFRELEARWTAIDEAGIDDETAAASAADAVFDVLIDRSIASTLYRHGSACRIVDGSALATLLDLPVTEFSSHEASFRDDGGSLIAPWPMTELIARRLVERDPQPILRWVEKEMAEFEKNATYGDTYRWGRNGEQGHIDAEWYASQENVYYNRPSWDLLLQWCGAEATERYDELKELRKEVRRLGKLADDAIGLARRHGAKQEADALERQLGIPAEILRAR